MLKFLFFTLMVTCLSKAFALTVHISWSTGNDNNDFAETKDITKPWKTLQRINSFSSHLKFGDSVLFLRGDSWQGSTFKPNADGIFIGAYGSGKNPMIDGGVNLAIDIDHKLSRITLKDITFVRSKMKGIVAQFGDGSNVSERYMTNSKIIKCCFWGGIIVQGSNNLFAGNLINGINNDGNGNGIWEHHQCCHDNYYQGNEVCNFTHRGIWTMIETHNCTFKENIIHNCFLTGIDLDGANSMVYNHIISKNLFYHINTDAVELENAFDCDVINNRMEKSGRACIYIINYKICKYRNGHGSNTGIGAILKCHVIGNVINGGGTGFSSIAIGIYRCGGITIAHNTINNFNGRNLDLDYRNSSEVSKIIVLFNIFSQLKPNSSIWLINFSKDDLGILAQDDFNCLYNGGIQDIYSSTFAKKSMSLKEYQEKTGKARNSYSIDPSFRDSNDLHLSDKSPLWKLLKDRFDKKNIRPGAY